MFGDTQQTSNYYNTFGWNMKLLLTDNVIQWHSSSTNHVSPDIIINQSRATWHHHPPITCYLASSSTNHVPRDIIINQSHTSWHHHPPITFHSASTLTKFTNKCCRSALMITSGQYNILIGPMLCHACSDWFNACWLWTIVNCIQMINKF